MEFPVALVQSVPISTLAQNATTLSTSFQARSARSNVQIRNTRIHQPKPAMTSVQQALSLKKLPKSVKTAQNHASPAKLPTSA